jgi:hypothetical protein
MIRLRAQLRMVLTLLLVLSGCGTPERSVGVATPALAPTAVLPASALPLDSPTPRSFVGAVGRKPEELVQLTRDAHGFRLQTTVGTFAHPTAWVSPSRILVTWMDRTSAGRGPWAALFLVDLTAESVSLLTLNGTFIPTSESGPFLLSDGGILIRNGGLDGATQLVVPPDRQAVKTVAPGDVWSAQWAASPDHTKVAWLEWDIPPNVDIPQSWNGCCSSGPFLQARSIAIWDRVRDRIWRFPMTDLYGSYPFAKLRWRQNNQAVLVNIAAQTAGPDAKSQLVELSMTGRRTVLAAHAGDCISVAFESADGSLYYDLHGCHGSNDAQLIHLFPDGHYEKVIEYLFGPERFQHYRLDEHGYLTMWTKDAATGTEETLTRQVVTGAIVSAPKLDQPPRLASPDGAWSIEPESALSTWDGTQELRIYATR